MAKTHPHIEDPAEAQLLEVVSGRPGPLVEAYIALDRIIRATLPDVKVSVDTVDAAIGYGAYQYGYNGWGMAAVTPFSKWVSLTLLQGSRIPDPEGLLTGTSTMRHLKVTGPGQVQHNQAAIQDLIEAAAELND